MDPLMMAGAGAGLGVLKGLKDQQQAERDRRLAAITAQYSPWTGMKPQAVQEANMLGDVAGGAFSGAAMGQNMNSADQYNKMMGAQTSYWDKLAAQQQPTIPNASTGNPVKQGPLRQNGTF